MPRLRLACYNIAWFARLFDRRNRLVADLEWSALGEVTRRRQATAIAEVLGRVDADCFAIIEAPNSGHRQSAWRNWRVLPRISACASGRR